MTVRPALIRASARGSVLRAWREASGVPAAELARRTGQSRSMISMLERGLREGHPGRRGREARALDPPAAYAGALNLTWDEERALTDMWASAGSITNGMARQAWAHNFQPPSSRAWLWLRFADGRADGKATLTWGSPFRAELSVRSTGGAFVILPTTRPNPPLEVQLDRPGWVDFGVGSVRADVAAKLDADHVIGSSLSQRGTAQLNSDETGVGSWARLINSASRALIRLGLDGRLAHSSAGMAKPPVETPTIDLDEAGTRRWLLTHPIDDGRRTTSTLLIEPISARALREARGLSRARTAELATAMDPNVRVTANHIEGLESSGRIPEVRLALARLDRVYGADGRLAVEVVSSCRDSYGPHPHRTKFPDFWVGPIWLLVRGPQPQSTGVLSLRWGPWQRDQQVTSGQIIAARKGPGPAGPLHVEIPRGWHYLAGVGLPPVAVDVGTGWWPTSHAAAMHELSAHLAAVITGHKPLASPDR